MLNIIAFAFPSTSFRMPNVASFTNLAFDTQKNKFRQFFFVFVVSFLHFNGFSMLHWSRGGWNSLKVMNNIQLDEVYSVWVLVLFIFGEEDCYQGDEKSHRFRFAFFWEDF